MIIYFAIVVILGLAIIFKLKNKFSLIITRKLFHLQILLILFPGMIIDPNVTKLSVGAMLYAFCTLECLR